MAAGSHGRDVAAVVSLAVALANAVAIAVAVAVAVATVCLGSRNDFFGIFSFYVSSGV